MQLQIRITMNPRLYVRDPESSELGRSIVVQGIRLIHEMGLEEFTFKKLAGAIGTTEAGIYRYFENKHRLLTYIITWYWTWLEYQLYFNTHHLTRATEKIDCIIDLLLSQGGNHLLPDQVDHASLHQIAMTEGNKSYFTRHVTEDNKAMLFKPYKDLCHRIAGAFTEYCPAYPYPHSLASTLMETAYHQLYFKANLPRLTDFGKARTNKPVRNFLRQLVFGALDAYAKK